MIMFICRRVLFLIPIAFGVSVLCFSLVHIAPGDLMSAVVAADAPQETVDKLREDYGFDEPLPIQYGKWLMRALSGDLGTSIATGRPVIDEVSSALSNTLILAAATLMICLPLGLFLGGLAGYYTNNALIDKVASLLAITGVSLPHYWFGLVLVIIFSIELNVLPAMGAGPGSWAMDWEHLKHLILPAVTLAMIPTGVVARTTRACVAETLSQEFVQALIAKGLPRRKVFLHVAKNAAPTVIAVMGLQFVVLLGGSILVETVFAWPGSGLLLNSAIFQRDLPVLQGTILVLAMLFVSINLLIDVLQTVLDPRIQRT